MSELRYNTDLWRALLAFRRRVYRDKGVIGIFRGMKLRNVPLPSTGASADQIWGIILETAFRHKDFLEEVLSSVIGKRAWARNEMGMDWRKGECWPQFYEKVMRYYLLREPENAGMFHDKLVWAGCTPKDWGEFMVNACREILKIGYSPHRRAALHRLRRIFATVKGGGVYEKLIPFLAKHATVTEAFKWHKQCLAQGDKPQDSSPADWIFKYLGAAGIMGEIRDFVEVFVRNGVNVAESSLVALLRGKGMKEDVLVMSVQMIKEGKIRREIFGDAFWEVVFGDKWLSEETLIGLMKVCRVQVLEQKGIRALVRRFKDVVEVNRFVEKLRRQGIEVPEEKLLRAQEEFDCYGARSIANPQRQLNKEHYDKLLAAQLTQRNLPSALNTLKDMLAYNIPIRPAILRFLIRSILRPRRRGHAPKTLPPQQVSKDDLALAINTLLSCLHGGMFVPPSLWQEIFRRLGMEYQLADLERLAVHLVEWYHPIRGQSMLQRFASVFVVTPEEERGFYAPKVRPMFWDEEESGRWGWLTHRRRTNRESPLRRLFPRSFMAAVVEWGVLGVFRRRAGILMALPGVPVHGGGGVVDIQQKKYESAPVVSTVAMGGSALNPQMGGGIRSLVTNQSPPILSLSSATPPPPPLNHSLSPPTIPPPPLPPPTPASPSPPLSSVTALPSFTHPTSPSPPPQSQPQPLPQNPLRLLPPRNRHHLGPPTSHLPAPPRRAPRPTHPTPRLSHPRACALRAQARLPALAA